MRARFASPRRAVGTGRRGSGLRGDAGATADRVAAAVLVPLIDRPDGVSVMLTQRSKQLENHAGQVSFPGGRMEAGDATPSDAALREAEEEVGLPRDRVDLIGRLDDYLTLTGFHITPVVGLIEPAFQLRPDPEEVDEVFEVPLSFVLDPANHQLVEWVRSDERRQHYVLAYGDRRIWGATAGMLVNLYEVLTA